jgi:hypothetical protein
MERRYALEMLDFIVSVSLNPQKTDLSKWTRMQLESVSKAMENEKEKFKVHLKHKVYNLSHQSEIELLINQYHSDLILMLDQLVENQTGLMQTNGPCSESFQVVAQGLGELLSFIETWYGQYLGLDERVPVTYLLVTFAELGKRLEKLRVSLLRRIPDKVLSDLVYKALADFPAGSRSKSTFRQVLYQKELIAALEEISRIRGADSLSSALNELLIYRNFNCKPYMNYLIDTVQRKVSSHAGLRDKISELMLRQKEFKQMHRKPDVKFVAGGEDIKKVLGKWFSHELHYLQARLSFESGMASEGQQFPGLKHYAKTKLALTVDQMALIVRAFVDSGIMPGQSVSQVFKLVSPYVSSLGRKDISWDSMRRKAYSSEDKDRKVVLDILQKLILSVNQY